MKELNFTKEQSDLIKSLSEDELKMMITDIDSFWHVAQFVKAVSEEVEIGDLSIVFDGKNDISINLKVEGEQC